MSPIQAILSLYKTHGKLNYGEGCNVLSHSMQSGLIAQAQGLDDELVLAAFLHDIGHLCPLEVGPADFERMGDYGIEAHDKWGENYLKAQGFSDRIVVPVKNHVASKRYLCYADPAYYEQLSHASKETLGYQGGPMREGEAKAFEESPYFEESILIRRIDDEAKGVNFELKEDYWLYFEALMKEALAAGK